jgi:hypothetical protein
MRKLLFFTLLVFHIACHKNREESKLPKPLQEVIAKTSCTCDPVLNKILLQDNIYYIMTWSGPTCYIPPVYYDENGNRINPPLTLALYAPKVLETVWKCRP